MNQDEATKVLRVIDLNAYGEDARTDTLGAMVLEFPDVDWETVVQSIEPHDRRRYEAEIQTSRDTLYARATGLVVAYWPESGEPVIGRVIRVHTGQFGEVREFDMKERKVWVKIVPATDEMKRNDEAKRAREACARAGVELSMDEVKARMNR